LRQSFVRRRIRQPAESAFAKGFGLRRSAVSDGARSKAGRLVKNEEYRNEENNLYMAQKFL
jgi:hypothetical protein